LAASEERIKRHLEQDSEAIVILSSSKEIVFQNTAFKQMHREGAMFTLRSRREGKRPKDVTLSDLTHHNESQVSFLNGEFHLKVRDVRFGG
jgi:hypothetical protein